MIFPCFFSRAADSDIEEVLLFVFCFSPQRVGFSPHLDKRKVKYSIKAGDI